MLVCGILEISMPGAKGLDPISIGRRGAVELEGGPRMGWGGGCG